MRPDEFTPIFRTLDENKATEAHRVRDLLTSSGIDAVVVDDRTPGVVAGTYEVRVPPAEQTQADAILKADPLATADTYYEPLDAGHDMDLVTVFSDESTVAEMEAEAIISVLEANGIRGMMIGSTILPSLRFEVKVPREDEARAQAALAEARAAGPAAAEEAERESEQA